MRYYVQAVDSVTGALYTWVEPEYADVWTADGYPGPNAATEIAITGAVDDGLTSKGGTVVGAGFQAVADILGIADAASTGTIFGLGLGDGRYVVTVTVTSTAENGDEWDNYFQLSLKRKSGVLTGVGTKFNTREDAQVGVACTNNAGQLQVTVTNNTGGGEDINSTLALSWIFIPRPDAP
jgi:hypothetical protein